MKGPSVRDINLNDPMSVNDPNSYWSDFRSEGPVQWSESHRAWVVLDHAELSEAFRDGRLLSADRVTPLERVAQHRPASFAKVVELLGGWMVFRDPLYTLTSAIRYATYSPLDESPLSRRQSRAW